MSSVVRYRVVSEFLAVRKCDESKGFLTVPAGAIVETAGDPQTADMIAIKLDGQLLMAFRCDLRERSEYLADLPESSRD